MHDIDRTQLESDFESDEFGWGGEAEARALVSAPAAAIRIMSRSVRMPTGLSSCTTTTEPTRFSRMRPAASRPNA